MEAFQHEVAQTNGMLQFIDDFEIMWEGVSVGLFQILEPKVNLEII